MRRKNEPIEPDNNLGDQSDTGEIAKVSDENEKAKKGTVSDYVKLGSDEVQIPRKVLREDVFRTLSDDEYNLDISLKN